MRREGVNGGYWASGDGGGSLAGSMISQSIGWLNLPYCSNVGMSPVKPVRGNNSGAGERPSKMSSIVFLFMGIVFMDEEGGDG